MVDTGAAGGPTRRGEGAEPGIRDHLAVLRRHWLVALLTFSLVLLAALASTWLTDPVYRAQAEVLLRTEQSEQLFPRTARDSPGQLVRSPTAEVEYATSDAFRAEARAAARTDVEVEVRQQAASDSSTLEFVAEADTPALAAATADAWAQAYVRLRQERDVDEAEALSAALIRDREGVTSQLSDLVEPLAALDEVIADEDDPVEVSRLLNQRQSLERSLEGDLAPLQDQLRRLNEQIFGLLVDTRVLKEDGALAVVSKRAEVPEGRSNGSLARSLAVGVLAGLVLAALAVSLAKQVPRRVRTAEELSAATGLEVLAEVPRGRLPAERGVEVVVRPTSPASEAYRTLLTELDREAPLTRPRRLLLVGTRSDDAATAVAMNIAALVAQVGTRVLLVGLDLRESRLHVGFLLDNEVGASDVLRGRVALTEAVRETPLDGEQLGVLPAGAPVPDPAMLLRSPRAELLFGVGVQDVDLVVYVGAPLTVVDSVIAARCVDGVVLVVSGRQETAADLADMADRLVAVGTRVHGTVLTGEPAPRRSEGRRRRPAAAPAPAPAGGS